MSILSAMGLGQFDWATPANQQTGMNTLLNNRRGGGGGGGSAIASYYNYLADIYGADTSARIAEMNGLSSQEVERIRQGGQLDIANVGLEGEKYKADSAERVAGLQDATNRYGIDSAERLGGYKTAGDIYGSELGYDARMAENATDRYGKDVEKYGLDIGREVAGMREAGETGRARIGASQGALSDILRDNRRGQVMGSPLMASIMGSGFNDLLGGAMGALNGTPAAATKTAQSNAWNPQNPYDSNSTVSALLSQITGQGQPAMDYPKAGAFQPSAGTGAPTPIAQRPGGLPAPTPQPAPQPPAQQPIPIPAGPGKQPITVKPMPISGGRPSAWIAPSQKQLELTKNSPYPVRW